MGTGMHEVKVGEIKIGKKSPLVLIAGPCVIESERSALTHAKLLKQITSEVGVPFIFKCSFDKANRTSIKSFRGPGLTKGLKILKKVKEKLNVPILSDVHCKRQVKDASKVLDIIQIPAFLSRQTDLIIEASSTGRPINLKKGQFMAPWDVRYAIEKIESTGNKNIIITERGYCFGYNNLVNDFRGLLIMKGYGYPIVYDGTHSLQLPGGLGSVSGGQREFVEPLVRAAVAVGVDGIFLEVHINPKKALCDGPNMIFLKDLRKLLIRIKKIESLIV